MLWDMLLNSMSGVCYGSRKSDPKIILLIESFFRSNYKQIPIRECRMYLLKKYNFGIRRNELFTSLTGRGLSSSILAFLFLVAASRPYGQHVKSLYTERPDDSEAVYFMSENYSIKTDGSMDISASLQAAINKVAKEKNFGIVFIPAGKYEISKTIYISKAFRLIGYGNKRPEIFLADNAPEYQHEEEQQGPDKLDTRAWWDKNN